MITRKVLLSMSNLKLMQWDWQIFFRVVGDILHLLQYPYRLYTLQTVMHKPA